MNEDLCCLNEQLVEVRAIYTLSDKGSDLDVVNTTEPLKLV